MNRGIAGNVFWSGLEASAAAGLAFASAFLIARLVGPGEVGIGAAAVAVHVLLWVVVNALFADAIVQRASLDDPALTAAFWASTAVGAGASLLQLGAGPLLGHVLGDARLKLMALPLALPFPLVGAAGALQGLLTRQRNYRALAGRTLIGQGLGTLTGITAALAGAGAWALVLQQSVNATTGALALLLRAGWRPRGRPHWPAARQMLALGLPLTASTLVQLGRYRLFALLIGATAGAAPLGQVHMAFRLVDTVRELTFTALWRLMLPPMVARQQDLAALRAVLDRCLGLAALIMLPLLGAMAVTVGPLIALLLGPVWAPAEAAALPLIALTAWLFLWFPAGAALIARGAPGPALAAGVAAILTTVTGVLALRPNSPSQAVGIWIGAQLLTSPYTLWATARRLCTPKLRPLRAGLPALAVSAAAVAISLLLDPLLAPHAGPALRILTRLAIGAPPCLLGLGLCVARLRRPAAVTVPEVVR